VIDREPLGTGTDGYYDWRCSPEILRPADTDDDPYTTVEDRSPAVIVWMLGALVAALVVCVALVWLGHE
jgi:hypothetical protein